MTRQQRTEDLAVAVKNVVRECVTPPAYLKQSKLKDSLNAECVQANAYVMCIKMLQAQELVSPFGAQSPEFDLWW
jgi:hypothetical protein